MIDANKIIVNLDCAAAHVLNLREVLTVPSMISELDCIAAELYEIRREVETAADEYTQELKKFADRLNIELDIDQLQQDGAQGSVDDYGRP